MLIQLPSGSADQPGPRHAEDCGSFQAGLRRDLASASIVSYDSMLGGPAKRAFDLALTLLTLPAWLTVLAVCAAWAKAHNRGAPVFMAEERIGYGGRPFRCFVLNMQAPPASVEVAAAADEVAADVDAPPAAETLPAEPARAEPQNAKWLSVLERLPQLFNVIAGDMALVGPRPLTRQQLEPLRTARRYYLSARPGVVGVRVVASSDEASQYKRYAMAWSVTADVLILWDQLGALLASAARPQPALSPAQAPE